MNALPNPFSFNSAVANSPSPSVDDTAVANSPVAAAVAIPEAEDIDGTQYIPELFSAYAARRCKDLISPPLQKPDRAVDDVVNFDALYDAITDSHPRDLDLDPAPLFLRKPRPAFLRALFELGGMA